MTAAFKDGRESCMKHYKHGLFQREVVQHLFLTFYWLPVGGVEGWCQRFNCARRQENATPNLRIPVVFDYPVVLRGDLFSKHFSLYVCIFGPILNYIIIHAHYSVSIKVKFFCVWRGNEIWSCFQSGFQHNRLKLNFVEIHK